MQRLVKVPELETSQRNKVQITLDSAIKVRRVALFLGISSVPFYVGFAASTTFARFLYVFLPISSALFALVIAWHSSNSLRISAVLSSTNSQTRDGVRSKVKADMSEVSNEPGTDENQPKIRTLGRRPRRNRKLPRVMMSRVTEEGTAVEESQLQTDMLTTNNSSEQFIGSSSIIQAIKEEQLQQ